jgi:hypothetical protein
MRDVILMVWPWMHAMLGSYDREVPLEGRDVPAMAALKYLSGWFRTKL